MQTALLYKDIDYVFEMLPLICLKHEYNIKEVDVERKTIIARKGRMLFSPVFELELRIFKLDNEIINIGVKILKKGVPQKDLEERFVDSIYKLL